MTAESILPKRWYGRQVFVTLSDGNVDGALVEFKYDGKLVSTNAQGVILEDDAGQVFRPWHAILSITLLKGAT